MTAVLALWLALGSPSAARADGGAEAERPSPAPATSEELSEEDLEILRDLEMLRNLELLRGWDPLEDLPIPVESSSPAGDSP